MSAVLDEVSKGTQVLLSKEALKKHKISGLRAAEIIDVKKTGDDRGKVEARFVAQLLLPRTATTCKLCSSPTRVNRTTGEAVCIEHDTCGHRHGFISHPTGLVLNGLTAEDFSKMQDYGD